MPAFIYSVVWTIWKGRKLILAPQARNFFQNGQRFWVLLLWKMTKKEKSQKKPKNRLGCRFSEKRPRAFKKSQKPVFWLEKRSHGNRVIRGSRYFYRPPFPRVTTEYQGKIFMYWLNFPDGLDFSGDSLCFIINLLSCKASVKLEKKQGWVCTSEAFFRRADSLARFSVILAILLLHGQSGQASFDTLRARLSRHPEFFETEGTEA